MNAAAGKNIILLNLKLYFRKVSTINKLSGGSNDISTNTRYGKKDVSNPIWHIINSRDW
jgi:hypothetical protein